MSVCPGTPAVPNFPPPTPDSDNLCETNFDPLLKHGNFIDSSCGASPRSQPPGFNVGAAPSIPIRNSDYFETDTQMAGKAQPSTVDKPQTPKRVSDHPEESPAMESPNWLPPGWAVKNKMRTSGSTAGSTDKYYVDPASGRKFRSKNEVLFFLENGSRRKNKKPKENAEGYNNSESQVPGKKQRQSGTPKGGGREMKGGNGKKGEKRRKTDDGLLNLDFGKVPVSVAWVLSSTEDEGWKAFVEEEQVTDESKQAWDDAFHLATEKRGF